MSWMATEAAGGRACAMLARLRAAGLVRVDASNQPLLYGATDNQQDDGEDDCYSQDLPGAKTTQHPNRCSRPDRCRGRKALDLNTCRTMQDHTRTEETDTRNDPPGSPGLHRQQDPSPPPALQWLTRAQPAQAFVFPSTCGAARD